MMKKINLDEFWNKRYPHGKLPKYAKDIALDLVREVLELAAENATYDKKYVPSKVNKQSILDTINQIE